MYRELASTLKLASNKHKTPRDKSISEYRAVSGPKTKTPPKKIQQKEISGFLNADKSGKSDQKREKNYVNGVFRDFIDVFLKGNK